MTVPAGGAGRDDHPDQHTEVPEGSAPGLPADSGISGGERTAPDDIQAGGEATDAVADSSGGQTRDLGATGDSSGSSS